MSTNKLAGQELQIYNDGFRFGYVRAAEGFIALVEDHLKQVKKLRDLTLDFVQINEPPE